MNVYIATAGTYGDYRILHVFANPDDAWSYKFTEAVEERVLHEGPVEVRTEHSIVWFPNPDDWRIGKGPNPRESRDDEDYSDFPGVTVEWRDSPKPQPDCPWLFVKGWDLEAVRKAYTEQRAAYERDGMPS